MKTPEKYNAFVIREKKDGSFSRKIEKLDFPTLGKDEIIIHVKYAALNYKDALSSTGHKGITRKFPHVPGVDAVGIVVACANNEFQIGEAVIVTSYDFGMNTPGGFQEYIKVPTTWPVLKPDSLSMEEAMILGTAGFTAALSLYKMQENSQKPEMGPILVTGATGGVGSMAVSILALNGYEVIAASGKTAAHPYLKELGAKKIISREESNDQSGRPLLRSQWAGAIDTIGGNTLATCIKACGRNGNVAVCGLVVSPELETTVYPFILNGVNLLGIETAETPRAIRIEIWSLLANQWKPKHLQEIKNVISLTELQTEIDKMLKGNSKGRTIVKF